MTIVKWLGRNWAAIILVGFAIAFFFDRQDKNRMRKRAKFTVGRIDGWHYTAKSGRFFGFYFQVGGQRYGGSSGWQAPMKEANGSPCLVEYDSLNPTINVGHFNVLLSDSIQPPPDGWRVPPFPVPHWLLARSRD